MEENLFWAIFRKAEICSHFYRAKTCMIKGKQKWNVFFSVIIGPICCLFEHNVCFQCDANIMANEKLKIWYSHLWMSLSDSACLCRDGVKQRITLPTPKSFPLKFWTFFIWNGEKSSVDDSGQMRWCWLVNWNGRIPFPWLISLQPCVTLKSRHSLCLDFSMSPHKQIKMCVTNQSKMCAPPRFSFSFSML